MCAYILLYRILDVERFILGLLNSAFYAEYLMSSVITCVSSLLTCILLCVRVLFKLHMN